MALLTTTKEWLEVASTTIENYRPKFTDEVTDALPLIKTLKNRIGVTLGGGDGIVEQVMYAHNQTVGSVGPWDVLNLTPQDVFSAIKDDYGIVHGSVVFSEDEVERNMGPQAQMNLLKGRVKNLKISFTSSLNTMLYKDGTGNGGLDLNGLALLVNDYGTNTCHGVGANNEAWWRNVSFTYETSDALGHLQGGTANTLSLVESVGGGTESDTAFLSSLDKGYNEILFGDTGANLAITSFPVWERIKQIKLSDKRFWMEDTRVVDPGFRFVDFNGVPVTPDRAIPGDLVSGATTWTGRFYWLNLDFMNFYIHEKKNFEVGDFISLRPKQAVYAMNMFLKAQLMVNKRNAQCVIHSLKGV